MRRSQLKITSYYSANEASATQLPASAWSAMGVPAEAYSKDNVSLMLEDPPAPSALPFQPAPSEHSTASLVKTLPEPLQQPQQQPPQLGHQSVVSISTADALLLDEAITAGEAGVSQPLDSQLSASTLLQQAQMLQPRATWPSCRSGAVLAARETKPLLQRLLQMGTLMFYSGCGASSLHAHGTSRPPESLLPMGTWTSCDSCGASSLHAHGTSRPAP